jgi:signal transduction histidine kinase
VGVGWLPDESPAIMAAISLLVLGPVCLNSLLGTYRRAVDGRHEQLCWIVRGAAVTVFTPFLGVLVPFGLPLSAYQALSALALLALPTGAAVAVLRLRLFDPGTSETTRMLDRSAVSIVAVALLLPAYWLAVLALGLPALPTAGFAFAAWHPLRRPIRNLVERTRSESRAHFALLELGRRLEKTVAPDRVLPESVDSLANALDLSYVAIEVRDVDGCVLAAEARGDVRADAEVFELTHHGELVGRLAVASAKGDGRLVPDDRQLLERLCGQLGVAAYGVRQTAALLRTKERLVTVHEEERSRLRRAHHDGIKPALSGVICELDAALNMCGDVEGGQAVLRRVAKQVASAKAMVGSITTDIRRLGDDRGPLQLDELGLVGALRNHVARFALPPSDLILHVHAPENLKGLPAEMEVSVFLLVCEAVENVRRHAGATRCDVVLSLQDGFLHVEVGDNGLGLRPGHQQGVGMSSMEARVEELEGDFAVHSIPGQGVRVCADLPLPPR